MSVGSTMHIEDMMLLNTVLASNIYRHILYAGVWYCPDVYVLYE